MAQEENNAEIDLNYDDFIQDVTARNAEDSERAQSAGESRQKIKEFLDETGLNNKVYSFCRSVLKQKKYATQSDMIRSMKEALPHVEAYVLGNQPDMFDKKNAATEEPVDFTGPDEEPTSKSEEPEPATDDETVEFNDAVDEVSDDSGNVHPFGTGKRA